TPLDTVLRVLGQDPVPPRRHNPRLRRVLETICLKCLEKDPRQRYASAQQLADDLRCYLEGEPVVARSLGYLGRLGRWASAHPALAATFSALAIFYTNHLLLLLLRAPGEGGFFHRFVTGLMVLWAAGAGAFQWLAVRPRWRSVAVYGWAALDVVLYTALLWVKDEPASPLLVGYLLLIAVAALRFRVALVWFVTELCLGAYLGLALKAHWRRPEDAGALPHVPAVFRLRLLLMGMIKSFLLALTPGSLPAHRPRAAP